MTCTEVARAIGASQSTAFGALTRLVKSGQISKDGMRYRRAAKAAKEAL